MGVVTMHRDGTITTQTSEEHYAEMLAKRDPNKTNHIINIKGYCGCLRGDSTLKKQFADVRIGNGRIYFNGTWEELEVYEDWLVDNEGKLGFKCI